MGDFIKKFFDIKFWKFILVGVINTLVGNGLQFVLFALFACFCLSKDLNINVTFCVTSCACSAVGIFYPLSFHFKFKYPNCTFANISNATFASGARGLFDIFLAMFIALLIKSHLCFND